MTNEEMADFLSELKNRNEIPIDEDEYYLLGNIADHLMEDVDIEPTEPICEIVFGIPYYFCGNCKTMLNMYGNKAKYCSECGRDVKWSDGKPIIENVQELVRCKDCKYFNDYFVECEKNNHTHKTAWFCADWERKEGR